MGKSLSKTVKTAIVSASVLLGASLLSNSEISAKENLFFSLGGSDPIERKSDFSFYNPETIRIGNFSDHHVSPIVSGYYSKGSFVTPMGNPGKNEEIGFDVGVRGLDNERNNPFSFYLLFAAGVMHSSQRFEALNTGKFNKTLRAEIGFVINTPVGGFSLGYGARHFSDLGTFSLSRGMNLDGATAAYIYKFK